MAVPHAALWQRPALRPFAPLVLTAWEDGYLTPADILALRKGMERADWLDEADRAALSGWLDPGSPPNPGALSALRRELRTIVQGVPAVHTLAELARALEPPECAEPTRASTLLAALEDDFFPAYDAGALWPAQTPTSRAPHAARPPEHAEQQLRLRKVLDGPHAAVRDAVRTLLEGPTFRPVSGLSREDYRAQVLDWVKALPSSGLLPMLYPQNAVAKRSVGPFVAAFETLAYFDLSLVVKFGVQFGLFGGAIEALGTERHHALLPQITRAELVGCFAMTERAHGSNVRDLRTRAVYDAETREFVVSTPGLGAGKEWIGNAARDATMAVVFAQLETQGESHGVHALLVPIRNTDMSPAPGVRIEDCGEKMGLNGVDNGRLWFDDVRVPRDALLDRFGSVAEDGTYTSPIPSSGRRFFTMLGTLVGGRIAVGGGALSASKAGLAIALRYAIRRHQFPNTEGVELPLIAYRTHQRRLLPRLAAAYAFGCAQNKLVAMAAGSDEGDAPEEGARDVETLAAGLKSLGTWQAVDTLQQCRECCGGQGYLTENRIDALRTDCEVFTTFEGDNVVLLQLVAKDLLHAFRRALTKSPLRTVARSIAGDVRAMIERTNPFRADDEGRLSDPEYQAALLEAREKSLLESLTKRIFARTRRGMDAQAAFEDCQDHALSLARAHVERFVLGAFQDAAREEPLLAELCALWGLWRIEADAGWFLENTLITPGVSRAIRTEVNTLAAKLAGDAEYLVDAFGVPARCLGPLADPGFLAASGLAPDAGADAAS